MCINPTDRFLETNSFILSTQERKFIMKAIFKIIIQVNQQKNATLLVLNCENVEAAWEF